MVTTTTGKVEGFFIVVFVPNREHVHLLYHLYSLFVLHIRSPRGPYYKRVVQRQGVHTIEDLLH